MKISGDQIQYKRQIGKLDSDQVWEIATKGGLHLVVAKRSGDRVETLGVGSHRAVARFIAKKKAPTMIISELSKSDWVPEEFYSHLVQKYLDVTEYMRTAAGFDP